MRSADLGARALSETLEDYLEIILALSLEQRTVRVRDIARAKAVRMPTVTAALKRLAELGLVRYAAREYVELSEAGSEVAARVAGRHRFLTRFLGGVLGVPREVAEADACSLEHRLSPPTLERLAAFVEYLDTCPQVGPELLGRFRECFGCAPRSSAACVASPCRLGHRGGPAPRKGGSALVALADLRVGCLGEVARVRGSAAARTELARKGILPGTRLTKVGRGGGRGRIVVELQDRELELGGAEARAIFVEAAESGEVRGDTPA
jgi:DtxR family transcriptional regulator, Mn-dependent transcriptional regulator